ncbi:MAG: hypothetical protein ACI3VD_04845 [Candidatus Limivicinus sp.]
MWEVLIQNSGVEKRKFANKTINRGKPCDARVWGCFPQVEAPTTIATKNIRFIYLLIEKISLL